MNGLKQPVFVDASVLVAAENAHDPAQQAACLAWLDALWLSRMGRVSQRELVRFYALCTRQAPQPMPKGDARAAIRRYQTWQAWSLDAATLESAWAVEARLGLPLEACLTVAAAQHSGCHWLLSLELGELAPSTDLATGLPPMRAAFATPPHSAAPACSPCTLEGVHVIDPRHLSPAQFLESV